MAKKPTASAARKAAGTASPWLEKIDAAIRREETWRAKAKKVVQRYRDERDKAALSTSSRVNILWSNTEVLKAALYVRTPKPDVRRRFPDAKNRNDISRVAAEVVERGLNYCLDTTDVDVPIGSAIDDFLLPGRGTVWASYEPEIEEAPDEDLPEGEDDAAGKPDAVDGDSESAPATSGRIASQYLCLEGVYWEDFCFGTARAWKDVPWVARRHAKSTAEFEAQFPEQEKVKGDYKLSNVSGDGSQSEEDYVEVWEIWVKAGKRRLYVARGYADILQDDEDPYKLGGFFPCPRPLVSIATTDRQIPLPEFLQYQDQANELDVVSTRIMKLEKELKWNGIYDATLPESATLADFSKADDAEFLPFKQFAALRERGGGIEAAFGFRPLDKIIAVITQLSVRKAQLVQEIYEVTGISDIVRGSTDPRETKGAQQLKAQFGSMRMQKRQREVQRFIREAYRLMGEIIAEHFTLETLVEMTGFELPTRAEQQAARAQIQQMQAAKASAASVPSAQAQLPPPGAGGPAPAMPGQGSMPQAPVAQAQPVRAIAPGAAPVLTAPQAPDKERKVFETANGPCWEDVIDLLRSDKLRGYRIDVETDTSVLEDADADKARRIEFMTAMDNMLEKAYLASVQAPMMLPLIKETFLFGVRSFNVGRALEQAAEDAFDELMQNPPPAPADKNAKPDTSETDKAKLALEAQTAQARDANEKAKLAADAQHNAASLQLEAQDKAARLQIERERLALQSDTANKDFALKTAAHNRGLLEEAAATAGSGVESTGGKSLFDQVLQSMAQLTQALVAGQQQQASEIAAMLSRLGQDQAAELRVLAEGQARQAESINGMTAAIAAPKRLVRDPRTNRAVGVETITGTVN